MNFFQNQSTLSLSTHANPAPSSSSSSNSPYRHPVNSRFTLSFNNLIRSQNNTARMHSPPTTTQQQQQQQPYFPGLHQQQQQQQPTRPRSPYFPGLHQQQQQQQTNRPKSPYFPGLRRIQSRRREKDTTAEQGTSSSIPPLPNQTQNQQQQQQQPRRSFSQPPPIPRVIRSATERLRTHNIPPETTTQPQSQARPNPPPPATNPSNNNNTFSIRLVPHLDATRSLHFEPIERNISPSVTLKLGRFTDRGLPQTNSDTRIAFKSKVVSRGHADIYTDPHGSFFIKDTKSSSGTFLNHIRLSAPGGESKPFPIRDGDILQLGVDYQGGTEEIYRCVKMRIELNRGWQRSANVFNQQALAQLRSLGVKGTAPTTTTATSQPPPPASGSTDQAPATATPIKASSEAIKPVSDCCICLFGVTVCQALFIAPCSHTYHYKCIRPLLQMHHPGFSCPLCRTFADLEADVETEEVVAPPSKKEPPPVLHHPASPRDRSTFLPPVAPHYSEPPSSDPLGTAMEEISQRALDDEQEPPQMSMYRGGANETMIAPSPMVQDGMESSPASYERTTGTTGLMITNQPMMMGLVVEEEPEDHLQPTSSSEPSSSSTSSSASEDRDHPILNTFLTNRRSSVQSDASFNHHHLSSSNHLPKNSLQSTHHPLDNVLLSPSPPSMNNQNKSLDRFVFFLLFFLLFILSFAHPLFFRVGSLHRSSSPNIDVDNTDVAIPNDN